MSQSSVSLLPLPSDPIAQALTNGTYWVLTPDRTVTWAIADGIDFVVGPIATAAVQTLTKILASFSEVANINFAYQGYYASFVSAPANIVLTGTFTPNFFNNPAAALAWAYFPNEPMTDGQIAALFGTSAAYPNAAGDVILNIANPSIAASTFTPGSQGYFAILHELGHSLGLKHPHDGGGTGRPTFAQLGINFADTQYLTVMSYNEGDPLLQWWANLGFPVDVGFPTTLMPIDVLALQSIYGANTTTRSGNTVYSVFNDGVVETFWDAGGTDTLSAANSSYGWTFDTLDYRGYTLTSARPAGAVVDTKFYINLENFGGSAFGDVIQGSAGGNVIAGLGGNDVINGGTGNDSLDGGTGIDYAVLRGLATQYNLQSQGAGYGLSGPDGNDTLANMEFLRFGADFGQDWAVTNVALPDLASGKAAHLMEQITDLYVACFNRGPDPAGLAYWFKAVYTGEYSLRTIAERFTYELEYLQAYPNNLTNREFVNKIYLNLFDRAPDSGGWDWWTHELDSGNRPRSGFILDVIEGAYAPTSGPQDRDLIDNKHEVSLYYSGWLSLQPAEGFDAAITTVLNRVSGDANSVAGADRVIDYAFSHPETLVEIVGNAVLFDSLWAG